MKNYDAPANYQLGSYDDIITMISICVYRIYIRIYVYIYTYNVLNILCIYIYMQALEMMGYVYNMCIYQYITIYKSTMWWYVTLPVFWEVFGETDDNIGSCMLMLTTQLWVDSGGE